MKKDTCQGCGQSIWLDREDMWVDVDPLGYAEDFATVAHLCEKPANPGSNRHVPKGQ